MPEIPESRPPATAPASASSAERGRRGGIHGAGPSGFFDPYPAPPVSVPITNAHPTTKRSKNCSRECTS